MGESLWSRILGSRVEGFGFLGLGSNAYCLMSLFLAENVGSTGSFSVVIIR